MMIVLIVLLLLFVPCSHTNERLFEVVLYLEQQSNALSAVCQSMLLAKQWSRTLVEPGISASYLLRDKATSQWRGGAKSTLYFGDVYNFTQTCDRLDVDCVERRAESMSARQQQLLQCSARRRSAFVERGTAFRECCHNVLWRRVKQSSCEPPWGRNRHKSKRLGERNRCFSSAEQAAEVLGVDGGAHIVVADVMHQWWISGDLGGCQFDYHRRFFELAARYRRAKGVRRYVAMQLRTQAATQDIQQARALAAATSAAILRWLDNATAPAFDASTDHIFVAADTFRSTTGDYEPYDYKARQIYKNMMFNLMRALVRRFGDARVISSEQAHADIRELFGDEPAFRDDVPLLSRIVDHVLCVDASAFLNVNSLSKGAYHRHIVKQRQRNNLQVIELSI
jgi:hypothetical protein